MNTYSLSLTSTSSSAIVVIPEIKMEDYSQLTISLANIYERTLPIYMKIDWGDGDVQIYNNNIYDSAINSIIRYSPLLTNVYTKQYYPSATSLYKTLSAQLLINYSDGHYSWFIIPLKIRTYDYFDSIGDIKLQNTSIIFIYLSY